MVPPDSELTAETRRRHMPGTGSGAPFLVVAPSTRLRIATEPKVTAGSLTAPVPVWPVRVIDLSQSGEAPSPAAGKSWSRAQLSTGFHAFALQTEVAMVESFIRVQKDGE